MSERFKRVDVSPYLVGDVEERGVRWTVEGDVETSMVNDEGEHVTGVHTGEVFYDLADLIEAHFGYGQENNPRFYGPMRITIERT